jgi:hypothetical protein
MFFQKSLAAGRFSFFTVVFLALVFSFVKIRQVRTEPKFIPQSYAISWDIYGYYLHLPATIIHRDPGIENHAWLDSLNAKYQSERPWYQTWNGIKGRQVNVYPTGEAILWLPFFLVAHVSAGVLDYPQDGLSPPYQVMIMIAGLFYAILGLFLLRKLLLKFTTDKIAAVTLLLIGLGTNLYYYGSYDNSMPHIILFAVDTLIILLTISWHENPRRHIALFLGMLIGLATISRPSEIVWILVPLFWNIDSFRAIGVKFRFLLKHFSHVFLLGTGLVAVCFIQLVYWKYSSGWWVSNNHVEGFDFFRPFTLEVLFSYKKGWLLYTPVMIFAITGLLMLAAKRRKLFVPLFLFFAFNLWIISSWECWWYAGSFSQRPFVQSYGLLAIPLAFFIERISVAAKTWKWSFGGLLILLVLLNQFQCWQFMHGILHFELNTKKYYWHVFGKTSIDPEAVKYLEVDRGNLAPYEQVAHLYTGKSILAMDFETADQIQNEILIDSAGNKKCILTTPAHAFLCAYNQPFNSLTRADHLRIKVEADVFIPAENFDKEISIVFSMLGNRGQNYSYTAIPVQRLNAQPGQWSHISTWFITPHVLHDDDRVTLTIWNNGGAAVALFDNITYEVYEPVIVP